MKRIVEDLKDGRFKVTEETGEIWYSEPDRPITEGYRMYRGTVYPVLTQEQIDNERLPFFQLDHHDKYPTENEYAMPYLGYCLSHYAQSVAERVARIKIAQKLNMFDQINDDTENN